MSNVPSFELRTEKITLRGEDFIVREMMLEDRDAVMTAAQDQESGDQPNPNALAIALSVVDAHGDLRFNVQDTDTIKKWPQSVALALIEVVNRVSEFDIAGKDNSAEDEALGKSAAPSTSESSTGSAESLDAPAENSDEA